MEIIDTQLPEVKLVKPTVFGDQRGFFYELWNGERYSSKGFDAQYVQDNLSFSRKGVLRGLHFQNPSVQSKLVSVLQGEVFDVAVDIRVGSPRFGKWVGIYLSEKDKSQLYVPAGFAHGFCVVSEEALFWYKCSDQYNPAAERTIKWDDPSIDIDWPVTEPVVSDKDQAGVSLEEFREAHLPRYGGS